MIRNIDDRAEQSSRLGQTAVFLNVAVANLITQSSAKSGQKRSLGPIYCFFCNTYIIIIQPARSLKKNKNIKKHNYTQYNIDLRVACALNLYQCAWL